ncbi:DUF1488 family protein [Azospirillum rugosum]|uniref:DUF1488 family protein n=1 Tax=Azospirillum rugosum TaxID=416170 RepID=A0ABS4SG85_9PROT|nr:DUF1488 family protein [Azospirillum rugosum]MBP2291585.1 hypothetical protein [Azospirillum rugosum]MDQ0524603.1 hypothetical protein [Azospirillum rugosum]
MRTAAVPTPPDAEWSRAIDSLVFTPDGHRGRCVVHRLAFRALLGLRQPEPADGLAHFAAHRAAYQRAAARKIVDRGLPPDASLHLTSRAVQRALEETASA